MGEGDIRAVLNSLLSEKDDAGLPKPTKNCTLQELLIYVHAGCHRYHVPDKVVILRPSVPGGLIALGQTPPCQGRDAPLSSGTCGPLYGGRGPLHCLLSYCPKSRL